MSIRLNQLKGLLPILAGSLVLTAISVDKADAALVRRSFTLNATAPYSGTGFFDYDDAALIPTGSNFYADIVNASFGYTGQPTESITDPFKRVNFGSASDFLGIDLEIPDPFDPPNTLLIANEDAYTAFSTPNETLNNNVVSYGAATEIPTPALLPGLIGLGWSAIRRRQTMKQDT